MATELLTSDWQPQNFFETTLSSDITDTATDIPLTTVPTYTEGTLVINPDSNDREIIYYNSKDTLKVVCPANGRGYDNSVANSHTSGTKVIMAPIADWFNGLKTLFTTTPAGWTDVGDTPDTVVNNGNRSYTLTFNSTDLTDTLSEGMRFRTTRGTAAPDQCADLEAGSNQYFSKSSPTGITFTDDFTCMAWVKLESYDSGSNRDILTRFSTTGFKFNIETSGAIRILGSNGSALVGISEQTVPLGRWVHIAATLNMSGSTSSMWIDGVSIPVDNTDSGDSSLTQAGDLVVGNVGGGTNPFDGKLSQVALFDAILSEATIREYMTRPLTGSETNCVAAYSLDNDITDLTSNNNDLTANGGAAATDNDSPFGNLGASTTLDYGVITKVEYSTNTDVTVQVPEGCTIDATNSISSVAYSTNSSPYGFVRSKNRYELLTLDGNTDNLTSTTAWQQVGNMEILAPVGEWTVKWQVNVTAARTSGTAIAVVSSVSASTSAIAAHGRTTSGYDKGSVNFSTNTSGETSAPYSIGTAKKLYAICSTSSTAGLTGYQFDHGLNEAKGYISLTPDYL